MTLQEQQALESEYVMPTFARKPVEFVRGQGIRLYDDAGTEYLDFLSGIGVVSLGHCAPALVAAVQGQAAELVHVSNYYYIEHRGQVARMLSDLLNAEAPAVDRTPWKSFFANSGAEANECAIKIARLHGRRRAEAEGASAVPRLIVTLEGSFHGRTLATLAATAQPVKQEAFQPLPEGFVATPINDVAALEALFAARGPEICAVMLECIQGESGVHPCTAEFLQAARRLTAEQGALLICDEVQCGCFRTGKPFGFQNFGVLPDVVTIAKGVAGGFPAGACAARDAAAEVLQPGDHGSTFGGSNLAMAAAQVTLTALAAPGFAEQVLEAGAYLRERLAALSQVEEARGYGLMVGADLAEGAPAAPDVVSAALKAGLVLNATGSRTLRFLPPLICEKAHIDTLVERLAPLLEG